MDGSPSGSGSRGGGASAGAGPVTDAWEVPPCPAAFPSPPLQAHSARAVGTRSEAVVRIRRVEYDAAMNRSKACLLALGAWLAQAGCGDDAAPPPPQITTTVEGGLVLTVTTDPLALTITRDGQVVAESAAFVEVGVVDDVQERKYYDPAAPQAEIRWRVAQRATAWDAAASRLTLALDGAGGGSAALVVSGGTLTLETAGVPGAVLARLVLPLAAGEELYGFGLTLDSAASRGVVREMQFRVDFDSESTLNELHVPVPLAIYPGRDLGFFAEERRVGAFDVGAAREGAVLVTFATPSLELHVLAGTAFEVLDRYTTMTGRPIVPPEWAFAPFQWRNEHRDQAEVLEDAQAIRDHDIPGSTVWVDNPWQTGYNTFEFEPARFPDPQGMVDQLAALGFRSMVWSTPYVNPDGATDADYEEARDLGYFVTDDLGRAFNWPWQDGPGALVDFTKPEAMAWYRQRIARATDLGIRGFKLDFGEDLVPEVGGNTSPMQLAAGGPDTLHGYYAFYYHTAYLGQLPPGDGFLLVRAGTWGTQTVATAIWPGDLDNDFSRHDPVNVGGLPAGIAAGLSLSASGFPFYGSDIGGFRNGVSTTEALIRWAEYAALGTIMQLGGGGGQGTSHNPWDTTLYGPEALPIYRTYARLHTDLFPYLYTYAKRAGETGVPVTRPPGMIYPGHPYEDAFLCGDALFVAPVVEEGATTRTVTLPPGEWVDWWTGARVAGGAALTVPAPLDTLPLWRKVGEIVVLLATEVDTFVAATAPGIVSLTDPDAARGVRVLVTPGEGESTFALYDGSSVRVVGEAAAVGVEAAAGTRHRDFRFEVDWPSSTVDPATADVPVAADEAALDACGAPGCWWWDAATRRVLVRLVDVGAGASARVE